MNSHYIGREELAGLVRDAVRTGDTGPLYPTLRRIADGYVARRGFDLDPDDVAQHLALNVHRHVAKLDPAANCFGYLTKICNRVCCDLTAKEERHRAKLDGYRNSKTGTGKRRGRAGAEM